MNNKLGIFRYSWALCKNKIFSTKMAILIFWLFFIQHFFVAGVKKFCISANHPITLFYIPYLISNVYFGIIFMAVIIYFFSDVPFMQRYGMYQIIRLGRKKWVLGQIINIFLCSLSIVLITIIEGAVIFWPYIEFSDKWGRVLYTLALTNVSEHIPMYISINYSFINQYNPVIALGMTAFLVVMIICFIALLMFAISLVWSRTLALGVAFFLVALPIVIKDIDVQKQLWFSRFSPLSWLQISELNGKQFGFTVLPDVRYAVVAIILLNLILGAIIFWKINRVDFEWLNEV